MYLGRAISVKIEDFEEYPNIKPEALWRLESVTYYKDELVIQPPQRALD
ncbi:hypothetical protein [Mastigocoleus testarum]|nr:hypothetical protein [Mastigocoleus testarum]